MFEFVFGLCCDSVWLFVQLCCYLGIVVCFVLGYLIQFIFDVKLFDGFSGMLVDFIDLYVWCEVYLLGVGWIGFDLMLGLFVGEGYILFVCMLQLMSVVLVEGLIDECEVLFEYEMSVMCVYELLCVMKLYMEVQWDVVFVFGMQVDGVLVVGDVWFMQGGELIFVLIDDCDGVEWNIDVFGLIKCGYVIEFVQWLCVEYGDGGFLYFGQGKWYLGE